MTKAEREYVDQAAELAARKAVEKMETRLHCVNHGNDLTKLKTTVADNKGHIDENRAHGTNDRRMIITGVTILIVAEIVMKIFL